ncbi:MAG: ABC transporter ATP-binding protein [Blastopirellula sp.]|nr:MAG: ABC transporter ATP-binding protein [Blastopirellula sp.]
MIELHGVSKAFGETLALKTTDFNLESGKTTALLGPSGCGKSTLLRVMVGLIPTDTGQVLFDKTVITKQNSRQIRHRIGYVIQDGGLFPHLTGRGNVTLMAKHLGWERDKIAARVEELEALTQLPTGSIDRYPAQMSGGQRQRVSMIRALFLDPDLVVLDEPMGALDPMIRSELQTQLREIFTSLSKTVVMVTHDISEAGFLADTVALLKDGRIAQQGTLADLVERPAVPFVTDFINAQRSPLESLRSNAS